MTSIPVPVMRDSNNHINSLEYNRKRYMFSLDTEGNVLSIDVSESYCVAKFGHAPANPRTGEQIVFDALESYSSKGNIVSYEWDFGDGNMTTLEQPIIHHTYAEPGSYSVALKVIDDNDFWDTASKTLKIYYVTDLNEDGTVNIVDISMVAIAFGTKPGDEHWDSIADMDKNEEINIIDISIVALDYGNTA